MGYRWTKSCKRVTGKLTLFYLKDLTWSDNNNMYLGPVVAAQQVLDPSPQHPHLREEKKGGGGGGGGGGHASCNQVLGVYPRVQVLVTSPDVHGRSFIFVSPTRSGDTMDSSSWSSASSSAPSSASAEISC